MYRASLETWEIVLFVAFVAFIVIVCVLGGKRTKKLQDEGKIVDREYDFYKYETYFFTRAAFLAVYNVVKMTDFSDAKVKISQNGEKSILFQSSDGWNAHLYYKGEHDGKKIYGYSLTSWETLKGCMMNSISANIMQTAIEKMFLLLDPNTTVESHKMQLKRRL